VSDGPLLVARGVSRRFSDHVALAETDLEVHRGEALALVGPNGAGKSTLLAILAGALQPSTGAVERADGVRAGWMPQRAAHYGRLSPRQNLELFARLEQAGDPQRMLERLELPDDDRPAAALIVGSGTAQGLPVETTDRFDPAAGAAVGAPGTFAAAAALDSGAVITGFGAGTLAAGNDSAVLPPQLTARPLKLEDRGPRLRGTSLTLLEDGTVLAFFNRLGMNGLNVSIPLLSMHAPYELVSKADLYEGYRAYKAFLAD